MARSISEISAEIIEEFSLFDDWMDKYQYLIEIGHNMPPLDESEKTEENIVRGCQSKVWLDAHYEDGNVIFGADSDAIITKGLIGLLTRVYSGQPPDKILSSELEFIDEIGIREHLSPNRSNGLNAMIKKMKLYALGLQHQKEKQN
jgi:cysteine desulfuration protein SufE